MDALIPFPCLCLVTDRRQCNGRPLEDVVSQAVEGGVNLVQLREKDLPAKHLLALAERLREITSGKALLFINDRVDIALACGADGVQLGEDGLPVEAARRIAGGLLLGRSVHSVDGALKAQADGADILVVGTIFPTGSHPDVETAGVGLLEQLRDQVEIPYVAIGGVTVENVESVIECGVAGAAVITAISKSPNPEQSSRELMQRMMASSQKGRRSMIALTVNGKEKQLDSPTNLLTYVESLGVNIQHIAVAYNGSVIRRDELTSVTLSEGDQVEIVRAVGGG